MAKVLVLVLSLVAAALAAPPAAVVPNKTRALVPMFPDGGRIVGGTTTTIDNYKYQIALLYYGQLICGGTLISTSWVVTAGHCTDGSSASALSIRAGSSYHSSGGSVVSVSRIIQNSQYNPSTVDYDISLLSLSSNVNNANAVPIALVAANTAISAGTTATVTGWGTTTEDGNLPNQLQVVQVPIVSASTCKAAYGSSSITARMLCAGETRGGKDACQGDSGGPLVTNGRLTGIVSWGYGCARPNYPGVYSSVPALRDWVAQNSGI